MNKTFKIYAVIFIIVMVILALLEVNKKEVTDWRKNYDVNQKSPFGLFVFNKEVKDLFKNNLTKLDVAPYDYYTEKDKKPHNILIVESEMDQESWNKILDEVSKGSDAMIIANRLPKNISDTIGFYGSKISYEDQNILKLTDKKYQNDFIKLDKFPSGRGFSYIKPNVQVLGKTVEENNDDQANFIKAPFGKGTIYAHCEPLFFNELLSFAIRKCKICAKCFFIFERQRNFMVCRKQYQRISFLIAFYSF